MITLTEEELQELKKEIREEIVEQMKLNKLDTLHDDVQQIIENTSSEPATKTQMIEKLAKMHDPHERQKLILEHAEMFGL